MAKALPIEHYRETYRSHQTVAGRFGVGIQDFNTRVAKRLAFNFVFGHPTPQQWSSAAYLEMKSITGDRCCPKAVVAPCVCKVRYTCEDHGNRCIGNHD
jgi:hypothetical protein